MAEWQDLRMKYPVFRFVSYEMSETQDDFTVNYHFDIPGFATFSPCWTFPKSRLYPLRVEGNTTLHKMAFSLGMAMVSHFWKKTFSPRLEILAGQLDIRQSAFFKKLYFNQLSRWTYPDDFPFDENNFMEIVSLGETPKGRKGAYKHLSGCLLSVEDSMETAVALEVLRESKEDIYCCPAYDTSGVSLTRIAGVADENVLFARCTLDGVAVLDFSPAVTLFAGWIIAYLHRLQYVVTPYTSTENQSTVEGGRCYHYEKSFEFEMDMRDYEQTHIGSGILGFSILRPLNVFQIAYLVAGMLEYHGEISSCKSKNNCGKCIGCLYDFCMLSPFLPHEYLADVFRKDLMEDEGLFSLFDQLIGLDDPQTAYKTECRGEINFAMVRAIRAMQLDGEPLPSLMRRYKKTDVYQEFSVAPDFYSKSADPDHYLPEHLSRLLLRHCLGR